MLLDIRRACGATPNRSAAATGANPQRFAGQGLPDAWGRWRRAEGKQECLKWAPRGRG
jgi:hypothetical protein